MSFDKQKPLGIDGIFTEPEAGCNPIRHIRANTTKYGKIGVSFLILWHQDAGVMMKKKPLILLRYGYQSEMRLKKWDVWK